MLIKELNHARLKAEHHLFCRSGLTTRDLRPPPQTRSQDG